MRDYLRIARLDHATKHIFIVPGIALAILLRGIQVFDPIANVIFGFLAAIALASANYVINEWLDRSFDRHHPEKSQRAAVQKELKPALVYVEYAIFAVIGLIFAAQVNGTFEIIALLFLLSGITYNVEPLRSKDRVYVDVLSESLNNPLRMMFGWAMIDPNTLPPASLLFAFWFVGAFLMNSKRLSEYRDIVAAGGLNQLKLYRRSFQHYTEERLSVANLIYALLASFFVAVFFVKYRIEYILLFPFMVALFAQYYAMALKPDSVARKPEQLFKSRGVIALSLATGVVFLLATFVDLPVLDQLTSQHFISIAPVD